MVSKIRTAGLVMMLLLASCSGKKAVPGGEDHDPARFVNPFVGTRDMGHTYPGATVPFGICLLYTSPSPRD